MPSHEVSDGLLLADPCNGPVDRTLEARAPELCQDVLGLTQRLKAKTLFSSTPNPKSKSQAFQSSNPKRSISCLKALKYKVSGLVPPGPKCFNNSASCRLPHDGLRWRPILPRSPATKTSEAEPPKNRQHPSACLLHVCCGDLCLSASKS